MLTRIETERIAKLVNEGVKIDDLSEDEHRSLANAIGFAISRNSDLRCYWVDQEMEYDEDGEPIEDTPERYLSYDFAFESAEPTVFFVYRDGTVKRIGK